MAPLQFFEQSLAETGARAMRWVRFDEAFLVETAPSVDGSGTRMVDPRRGVKVNHIWYWDSRLASPDLAGKSVEVRADPWDIRYVHVLVANKWHKCVSRFMASLRCYSAYEFAAAMEEVLARANRSRAE